MKKIIVCEKCPTSACYYKILRFLLEHATRKEIEGYLDELEKSFEQWKLLKILFILTIDNCRKCDTIARPEHVRARPKFHYTTGPAFLSIVFFNKFHV